MPDLGRPRYLLRHEQRAAGEMEQLGFELLYRLGCRRGKRPRDLRGGLALASFRRGSRPLGLGPPTVRAPAPVPTGDPSTGAAPGAGGVGCMDKPRTRSPPCTAASASQAPRPPSAAPLPARAAWAPASSSESLSECPSPPTRLRGRGLGPGPARSLARGHSGQRARVEAARRPRGQGGGAARPPRLPDPHRPPGGSPGVPVPCALPTPGCPAGAWTHNARPGPAPGGGHAAPVTSPPGGHFLASSLPLSASPPSPIPPQFQMLLWAPGRPFCALGSSAWHGAPGAEPTQPAAPAAPGGGGRESPPRAFGAPRHRRGRKHEGEPSRRAPRPARACPPRGRGGLK